MRTQNLLLLGLLTVLSSYSYGCFRCLDKQPAGSSDRIRVEGKWMVDESGRIRLFHGFNAVYKSSPWYPEDMLNDTKLDFLKSWGFTAVRLGTMWAGTMPARDTFNETYLSIIGKILSKLEDRGMYAILDVHQDVLSSKFDSYDGAPRWLIDLLPPSPNPYPWPWKNITAWAEGYLTQATSRAFQEIYDNVMGSRDYFAKFWQKVASVFKNTKNVLGYEILNEPWAGDVFSDPVLFLPGKAGANNLMPLYHVINSAIRSVDNETLVFYEPVTWGMITQGKYLGSGFTTVPGGPDYRNRSVLSYHYYCWLLQPGDHGSYGGIKRVVCDDVLGPLVFSAIQKDLSVTGGSSFLTEFGLCEPDGNPNSTATVECNFVMDQADKNLQSWTYWDWRFFDDGGHVQWDIARAFSRVYCKAVAGTPTSMAFDPVTKSFAFEYTYNPSIKAPTEIVVPSLQYPKGFNVSVSSGFTWKYLKDAGVVTVIPVTTISKPQAVSVNITKIG